MNMLVYIEFSLIGRKGENPDTKPGDLDWKSLRISKRRMV
jgi:hypothetical protein